MLKTDIIHLIPNMVVSNILVKEVNIKENFILMEIKPRKPIKKENNIIYHYVRTIWTN